MPARENLNGRFREWCKIARRIIIRKLKLFMTELIGFFDYLEIIRENYFLFYKEFIAFFIIYLGTF